MTCVSPNGRSQNGNVLITLKYRKFLFHEVYKHRADFGCQYFDVLPRKLMQLAISAAYYVL